MRVVFAFSLLATFLTAAAADPAPSAPPDPALNAKAVAAAPTKPILMMRGLDKITGRAFDIVAPLNVPVKFATLTVTARYCYSTPSSETPETAAFVQIDDARPDKPVRSVFRLDVCVEPGPQRNAAPAL